MTGDDRANDVLDAIYGAGHAANMPATLYFEVYYAEPTDAGGGTPADYPEAARVALTNDSTNFPAATDRRKTIDVDIDLPTPSVDTDTLVAWALHGHATNDDILHWDFFQDAPDGEADTPLKIPAGTLVIELA